LSGDALAYAIEERREHHTARDVTAQVVARRRMHEIRDDEKSPLVAAAVDD
jgi:hypothetical protein